jgi:hypothetical protein
MSNPRGMRQAMDVVELGHGVWLARLIVVSLLVTVLTGCFAPLPTAISVLDDRVQSTPTSTLASILDGSVQGATLAEIKAGIDKLYRDHPDINSFAVRSVVYTPATRDKVLKICSEGGLAATEQERETEQVLACAPLIFFYYYYGQQISAPESVDVARRLYWYAMTDKSEASKKVLTDLLRSWGIK